MQSDGVYESVMWNTMRVSGKYNGECRSTRVCKEE